MTPHAIIAFDAILKEIAQKWFNGLSSWSITSFLQLVELFSVHFIFSKWEKKISIHLAMIRQIKGEELKEYALKFNSEAALVSDLQDGVAYTAFLNGLLPGWFKFSMAESKVTSLVDALRRPKDFIQATEICARDVFILQESRKRLGEDSGA